MVFFFSLLLGARVGCVRAETRISCIHCRDEILRSNRSVARRGQLRIAHPTSRDTVCIVSQSRVISSLIRLCLRGKSPIATLRLQAVDNSGPRSRLAHPNRFDVPDWPTAHSVLPRAVVSSNASNPNIVQVSEFKSPMAMQRHFGLSRVPPAGFYRTAQRIAASSGYSATLLSSQYLRCRLSNPLTPRLFSVNLDHYFMNFMLCMATAPLTMPSALGVFTAGVPKRITHSGG